MFLYIMVIFFTIISIWTWANKRSIYLTYKLPGPRPLPFVGNALKFLCKDEDILDKLMNLIRSYPSPMRFWLGPKFILIFKELNQVEPILSSIKLASKDDIYEFIKEFDGEGLITSNGSKWKSDRKIMGPIFAKKHIEEYFALFLSHARILTEELGCVEGKTINIEPFLHRCILDIVNGKKTELQRQKDDTFGRILNRMYTIVHARMVKVWLQNNFLFKFSSYYRELEEGKRAIFNFLNQAIAEAELNDGQALINKIMKMRYVKNFAPGEDLKHHIMTLYSASEDTMTIELGFALVLLGMYPEVQQKLYEEIQATNIDEINLDALNKMVYLDQVVKEVLRLYPIAPFLLRKSSEDFPVGDLIIPKGTSVLIPVHSIHRDAKHWRNPNVFYPDHFSKEEVAKRHPFAFLGFSAGPRSCLGKKFAYLCIKVILVTLLQKYEFEADGTIDDKPLKCDISIRFKDDLYCVRLKRRNN